MAVVKKFGDDQGGNLAALVAYYAFFSLFPLLLVLVTILSYVLQGDASAQESIKNSVLAQFPIIGPQISSNVHEIHGHVLALVLGLATSLLAGLGVTSAAQNAMDRIWAVPFKDRPNFLRSRLRGLALLMSLGVMFLLATLASGLVYWRARWSARKGRRDRGVVAAQRRTVPRRVPVHDRPDGEDP